MKTTKQTLSFLLKKLPMPKDCVLFGWASGVPEETATGVAVWRNLTIDVSKKIPKGTAPYEKAEDCSDDEVYYLQLKEDLIEAMWQIISSGLGIQAACSKLLSRRRGESVQVFYSTGNFVTLRASYSHSEGRKTYWAIDFVAVVQTAR